MYNSWLGGLLTLATSYGALGGIVAVPLGRGLVLCREESGEVFLLNESAKAIWEVLSSTGRPEAAADYIVAHYGLAEEEAERAVICTLEEWQSAGLFEKPEKRSPPRNRRIAGQKYCKEITYRLFGRHFRLRFSGLDVGHQFHLKLAHMEVQQIADAPVIQVAVDNGIWRIHADSKSESTSSISEAAGLVARSIVQSLFPTMDFIGHFHAAAVHTGVSTLLLPGVKGSGKTTLSLSLQSSGYEFLCDDAVFFDLRMEAMPFPTRPCVKEGSWPALESIVDLGKGDCLKNGDNRIKYLTPPESALRLRPDGRRIRRIVFPTYRDRHPTELRELSASECLQRLVEEGNWLSLKRYAIKAWAQWLDETPAYSLVYSSLDEAAQAIEEIVG